MKPPPESLSARDVTRVFRTLSDDTRFRLLRLLARDELTVNELASITQFAQPRISNHLKILREENLITERRAGSWRFYRVDADVLDEVTRSLWPALQAAWADEEQFAADDKRLAEVLAARTSQETHAFFDQLAARWDEIRDSLFGGAVGREILRTFLPPDLVVADIGTGTGYVLQLFGSRARRIIAVDPSEVMLAVAREKAQASELDNVEFQLADAETADLPMAGVDVITMVQVLHHVEDPLKALQHLRPALRAGGMLIVNDFLEHQEQWLRQELNHRWLGFSQGRVAAWLEQAGMQLESWEVIPGRLYALPDGQRVTIPDSFTASAKVVL